MDLLGRDLNDDRDRGNNNNVKRRSSRGELLVNPLLLGWENVRPTRRKCLSTIFSLPFVSSLSVFFDCAVLGDVGANRGIFY